MIYTIGHYLRSVPWSDTVHYGSYKAKTSKTLASQPNNKKDKPEKNTREKF